MRKKLEPGRQPHWQALGPNGIHLGYQRKPDEPDGRWLLRRALGPNRYSITPLGRADDKMPANGRTVLSFDQAHAAARALADVPEAGKFHRISVRQALTLYEEHKLHLGQKVDTRGAVHILPALGDIAVVDLTAERLRKWLSGMAESRAQKRPTSDGKLQFFDEATDDEAVRKRRASANRVLVILKAALNFCFDEGHVANRDAWGRKLKAFGGTDQPRTAYLSITEAQRLLNACEPDFRNLVRAGLETACRYSELGRLEVRDFNPDANSLTIRKSKTNKARHITLTDEAAAFFKALIAGKTGAERMFLKADGSTWTKGNQDTPMREACAWAKIEPRLGFHQLRHTWCSHAVMSGMPLLLVARTLGHSSTKHVEKTYGHLAPGYITDTIKAHAPRYGVPVDGKVRPLR